jgi:hypothetical protein
VDTAETYFRASGLQPGVLYRTKVNGMTDDVDLVVYGDMSMSSPSELCVSEKVGHYAESCVAPASSAGELWIKVDGEWTNAGAQFSIEVSAAAPVTLAGTLAFPAQLPRTADIGPTTDLFKVSGLTPGAKYEVKLSQLSADIDLQVYGDLYEYALLCASYKEGTADDACIAKAGTAGELYVAVSGETTHGGGTYTLGLTLK